VAHCSAATKPCINCAAGPALMVEIARTLHALIERGEIRRPRRSIKLLFLIEGLGSRAYFDANPDLPKQVKTAFVLDSVGHDQGKLRSVLVNYKSPDSVPSFVNDYFAGVMERAPKDGTWVFKDDTDISPVQFVQAPYTPWSDNHYWAAYGIPSPLIMSWPDKYFHTQLLTADYADPRVFRRVGVTTALAAYEIADASADEARLIADEVEARAALRMVLVEREAARGVLAARRAGASADDLTRIVARTCRRLTYLSSQGTWDAFAAFGLDLGDDLYRPDASLSPDAAKERLMGLLPDGTTINTAPPSGGVLSAVPRRTYNAPGTALSGSSYPELVALVERMRAQDPTVIFDTLRPICDELWNLIDGQRTVGEIAEALVMQFDIQVDPEVLVPLFEGLARSGEIEL
jgi:hypothetical protein